MTRILARRLIQYGLLLFFALVINFMLPRLAPGGPLQTIAGADVGLLTPDELAQLRRDYGLDRPLYEQFGDYVGQTVSGDLGYSYRQGRPVSEILFARIPWTLLLAGSGLLIATLIGILFGAYAAYHRGSRRDVSLTGAFVFLQSLPAFWIGMVFIAIFATRLRLLPTFGAQSIVPPEAFVDQLFDIAIHLVMPLTVLVLASIPHIFLTTRYAMLGVLQEDFIDTAYAKGLRRGVIVLRHALRNALLPVLTVFALHLGAVVSGATVIETVFSYPGVGRLMYESVVARDYPVLQAGFLVITLSIVAANLLADLLYPVLDPRVRVGGR
ncbi:MAG TPA: ABC transporter permease [Candidatus Limnocylindrales bacterium]|nr:ABC transporter permease [Candidatus Limnocylindrales bacterium]